MAHRLLLKRAPIGPNLEDYNVLENAVGFEPTREAAMAAFAKSWRKE